MSYYETVPLSDGALIKLSSQKRYGGAVPPADVWAYVLKGQLVLATEAQTTMISEQVSELYDGRDMMFYDGVSEYLSPSIYVRHATQGNFWVRMDAPRVRNYVGDNVAEVEQFMVLIGGAAGFVAALDVSEVDEATNDWDI